MDLNDIEQTFILHWGEMGSKWGINRTVAQVHALLYITEHPLSAEEITHTLSVARSNVSTSLKELQGWRIIRVVHKLGDRRDHFQSLTDPWELFEIILQERKKREIDPTIDVISDCIRRAKEDPKANAHLLGRLEELGGFVTTMVGFYDSTSKLPRSAMMKLAKMGGRLQSVLGLK